MCGCGVVLGEDVDELHVEVGVGRGAGDAKVRCDGSRDGDVFFEGSAHEGEDVGALGGEALVREHVLLRRVEGRVVHVGDGMCRITGVFSERGLVGCGRIEGQSASGAEIELTLLGVLRRPCVVLLPDVATGLEDVGLGKMCVG